MVKYIKLSEWAKSNGVCYATARSYFKKGIIDGKQLSTGTILIKVNE